jgi:hypothetical protein
LKSAAKSTSKISSRSVKIENRFAGSQATQFASYAVAAPVSTLMKSRFDDLEISGING